ncbi:hypothetical protein FHG66_16065 [Rubellimicrobium rubrum]|uniref:Uncharacterized protein n=1 Tax=Rubellimicrobium rubrum TaxID=2585369 RepID=A0A5C4MUE6_9RHOB|nr:hypothetical protein [Rubellimicrobium rubrum]TNC47729.1 hypothetical protein FHG66_16065 [Rubellimicrobium rubrum]
MDAAALLVLLWGLPVSGLMAPSLIACEEAAASVRADMAAALRVRPGTIKANDALQQIQDWSVECRLLSAVPAEVFDARF